MIPSSSLVRSIQACLSALIFSSEILSTTTSHFHTTRATIVPITMTVRRRQNKIRLAMMSFACRSSATSSKIRISESDRVYGFFREVCSRPEISCIRLKWTDSDVFSLVVDIQRWGKDYFWWKFPQPTGCLPLFFSKIQKISASESRAPSAQREGYKANHFGLWV